MARTHLRGTATRTACALEIASPAWPAPLPIVDTLLDASDPCRRCLRIEATRPPPFVPTEAAPFRAGAREPVQLHARPDPEAVPRYYSSAYVIRSALQARDRRELGESLPSSSDPARFGKQIQETRDPSRGGRVHRQIDRDATVLRLIARAAYAPDVMAQIDIIAPGLEMGEALHAFELSMAGRCVRVPATRLGKHRRRATDGGVLTHRPVTDESVADEVRQRTGIALSVERVAGLRRAFFFFVSDELVARGLVGSGRGSDEKRDGGARWAGRLHG